MRQWWTLWRKNTDNVIADVVVVGLSFLCLVIAQFWPCVCDGKMPSPQAEAAPYVFAVGMVQKDGYGGLIGSGFVVDYKGNPRLISNWHVCRNLRVTKEARPWIRNSLFAQPIVVERTDKAKDLCLIRAPGNVFPKPGLELATAEAKRGDLLYFIGYVSNLLTVNIGVGYFVEEKRHRKKDCLDSDISTICHEVHTSFPVQAGMSGSPVINRQGNVAGVVYGRRMFNGVSVSGFYVPLKSLKEFLANKEKTK